MLVFALLLVIVVEGFVGTMLGFKFMATQAHDQQRVVEGKPPSQDQP